ncbi:MAG: D-hexose-6-phosphate mutarotase [Planctomycetota bacterium]
MTTHDLKPQIAPGTTLPALQTTAAQSPVAVTLYPHGATLTGVRFGDGPPLLYLSPTAVLDGSKPLRGGVPVCFPWFAVHPSDPDAAKHGTVRNKAWDIEYARYADPADAGSPAFDALLTTRTDPWEIAYRVCAFRSDADRPATGSIQLTVTVTNQSQEPRAFELALHTYFAVGDVRRVHVTGLRGRDFLDNLADTQTPMRPLRQRHRYTEDREQLRFDGECDRVYLGPTEGETAPITLHDPVLERAIEITAIGCPSAVVWNPHVETAKGFADLPDDAWTDFLCIESGLIADDAVTLGPGATHTAEVTIRETAV